MPEARDEDQWKRLGELLQEQRVRLDRRYRNRTLFSAERQINYRLAQDLETGARHDYKLATLADAEMAYGLKPGSVAAVLAGAEPQMADGHATAQTPDLTAQCELELRVLRSDILSDDQKRRFVAAHRAEEPDHRWCGFAEEQVRTGVASLAGAYAATGQPDVTSPEAARAAAG